MWMPKNLHALLLFSRIGNLKRNKYLDSETILLAVLNSLAYGFNTSRSSIAIHASFKSVLVESTSKLYFFKQLSHNFHPCLTQD